MVSVIKVRTRIEMKFSRKTFFYTGGLNDTARVSYFNSYLSSILGAIKDGCQVKGYIAWSLMDSFEWKAGFTEKFGLYHVDFKHPNKTRTPKLSAKVYSHIVKTKNIDFDHRPKLDPLHLSLTTEESSSCSMKASFVVNVVAIFVLTFTVSS